MKKRNSNLALVQLLAAFAVILSHAYVLTGHGTTEPLGLLTGGRIDFGSMSVAIFFIASGLLIAQSWNRAEDAARNRLCALGVFTVNRLLRIFPVMLSVTVLTVFVLGPLLTTLPFGEYFVHRDTVKYLNAAAMFKIPWYLPGVFDGGIVNGSLWTIPCQMWCYVIAAALGVCCVFRRKWLLLAVLVLVAILHFSDGALLPHVKKLFGAKPKVSIKLLFYFLTGATVGVFRPQLRASGLLALALLALGWPLWRTPLVTAAVAITFSYGLLALTEMREFVPGRFVPPLSFGVYVFAFPIQQMVKGWGADTPWANFLCALPLTLLLAWLCRVWVERPALRLRGKLTSPFLKDAEETILLHETDTIPGSPRVSIVIPCYNKACYLNECLDSLEAQTYRDFEVIIVDDGSSDPENARILEKIRRPNVRIVRRENGGAAAARNTGVRLARGAYILPVDADDRIAPAFLAAAVAVLDREPKVGIVGGETEYFGARTGRWNLPPYGFPEILYENCLVITCLYRKRDWEACGGYDETIRKGFEDWDFWLSLIERGADVRQLPMTALYYRQMADAAENSWWDAADNALVDMIHKIVANHRELFDRYPHYRDHLLKGGHSMRHYAYKVLVKALCLVTPVRSWRKRLQRSYKRFE